MNICLDIRSLLIPKTGVGHYTHNLLSALLALDNTNDYHLFYFNFLRKKHSLGRLYPDALLKEITVLPGRLCNLLWRYCDFPPIDMLLPGMNLFHFPNFTITPGTKAKVIVTVHDLSFIRYPQFTEPHNLQFLKKLFVRSITRANGIITVSQFTKDELIALFNLDPAKIAVVHNGIDPQFKKVYTSEHIREVQQKYALPPSYIFFAGTLEPRKNIPTLLRAYKLFKDKNKSLPHKLVIIGMKGWLYDAIFHDLKTLQLEQEVIFTGYVKDQDLPPLYQGGNALVYPSFYEGFGLPVAEAMASGVPVICSDTSSLKEVAQEAALFCSPLKAEEMSIAIEKILTDETLKNKLKEKGKKQSEQFS